MVTEEQPQAEKVTQFRPDYRPGLVRAIRTLALLGMLATVLYAIWSYQDDLTPENLKRLYLYLSVGDTKTDFSEYTFENGLNTVYAPFAGGLAVASGDTYYFISGRGGTRFSLQLKYANPTISAGDQYVLIFDPGNSGLCVANSYAEYLNTAMDSPILSAQMNRSGDFAVVTAGSGCRAAVTVYDKKQRQRCKWMTSQYYIQSASVSPDGDRFAALCLMQDGLTVRTKALLFTIGSKEADCEIDLGEKRVFSMCHDKNGALVILCDDGLYYYNDSGKEIGSYPFDTPLADFHMEEGEWPVLAFSASDNRKQQTEIVAMGDTASAVWKKTVSGAVRSLYRRDDRVFALLGDRLICADTVEKTMTNASQTGARAVICGSDKIPILIFSDRAEKVSWEE